MPAPKQQRAAREPLRVLVTPDKFKGTLDARAAAAAIAAGWRAVRPLDRLELLPMSDGGDGFGEVLGRWMKASIRRVATVNAAHRPCAARWWWVPGKRTALIESARVIGLSMLPLGKFHPFELDTRGLADVLLAASRRGARTCLVGVGGSATNDGGFGLALALGWRFVDGRGREILQWTQLETLRHILPPAQSPLARSQVVVAVDVQNPLLGPRGASRVYGPQKGLRAGDFSRAERCLGALARAVHQMSGRDLGSVPGAGAAGGLAFGLMAFCSARPVAGFDLFAQESRLQQRIGAFDLVVTGEGSLDHSTCMGKGVDRVAELCRRQHIPCVALAGVVKPCAALRQRFVWMGGLMEFTSEVEAKAFPRKWLKRLAARAATEATERIVVST